MSYQPDLESEYETGDQSKKDRHKRGARRNPSWHDVEKWRSRWSAETVANVLQLVGTGATAEEIGNHTGFGTIEVHTVPNGRKRVPDLRGLDVVLLPAEQRQIDKLDGQRLDLSYAQLHGARLSGLNLSSANLYRANLPKSTLRGTIFRHSILTKADLRDADLRDAIVDRAHLGYIKYSEDGYLQRGTILMEVDLRRADYVDPLMERVAKDQYYIYVANVKASRSRARWIAHKLWWLFSNYGKSPWIWAAWSLLFALTFALIYCYVLGPEYFEVRHLNWGFPTALYYSVVTFTTLGFGDITPTESLSAWLVMAEVVLGYIMLGGLVSIFATKLARRS